MSVTNKYKWLMIVEGETDVETYEKLLVSYGVVRNDFHVVSVRGKGFVCNAETWGNVNLSNVPRKSLFALVNHDKGRADFCGIILIVDSDINSADAFCGYRRNANWSYIGAVAPAIKNAGNYWHIDNIDGVKQIPIYGISVPMNSSGCLETDLLDSYGFPKEGQPEYENVVDAIQKASVYWQIPKHGDGKDWWVENKKAKLDKFIYSALSHGFKVSGEKPTLPTEPKVIQNIKATIGFGKNTGKLL